MTRLDVFCYLSELAFATRQRLMCQVKQLIAPSLRRFKQRHDGISLR